MLILCKLKLYINSSNLLI